MNHTSWWKRFTTCVTDTVNAFCDARDAHHGTPWERLSVAYPDPREALRALELFRATRLQITAVAA